MTCNNGIVIMQNIRLEDKASSILSNFHYATPLVFDARIKKTRAGLQLRLIVIEVSSWRILRRQPVNDTGSLLLTT